MSSISINTDLGTIRLSLRPDAAPTTASHISDLVKTGIFSDVVFYRSDFVIQTGLYSTGKSSSLPNLPMNETATGVRISNTRGTVAVAHHDVPDNGNSEFFINLGANTHLDTAYGGYCVFAQVEEDDAASFKVVDDIAAAVKSGTNVKVSSMTVA
ncbi:hypothetical protein TeGR_g12036 [Tetraparma gracilis]|uniref:peptidylprolyl isomerase n=1 Tax=Tetraparma gracilis TaxID=2962635 RepID=A0ABQ6MC79_9STRA|nr:hypothetical protein TeGR_g12036 [Tetraparma gracilis]